MLRLYYTDLIELASALIFLVVFKIVLLYGMNKMAALVSDDPVPKAAKPKRKLPRHLDHLRLFMAIVLALNGVWQIRPVMLSVSLHQLTAAGSSLAAAHWWLADASWLNIWSVMIDLCFAALLFSFAHPVSVRIVSGLFAAYALAAWIWLDGLHHLIGTSPSFLAGSPGAALLLCLASLPLVVQAKGLTRWFEYGVLVWWGLLFVLQWLPESQFWTGRGYRVLGQLYPARLPFGLQSWDDPTLGWLAVHGVAGTLIIGLAALAMAALWWWKKERWVSVTAVVLLAIVWLVFEGAGLGGAYVFPFGGAPVLALWVFYARVYGRGETVSGTRSVDTELKA